MKYCFSVIVLFCLVFILSCKQTNDKVPSKKSTSDTLNSMAVYIKPDLSEMDVSWCPANYPMENMQGDIKHKLIARVIYSRPHKKGRSIFGTSNASLCIYGKPWRLGANEATELTFFENVQIGGKTMVKGTYVLYCIPQLDKWTIVFNSNLYTWGLHIDQTKDVFKTEIPVISQSPSVEDFTIFFDENLQGANMNMVWDNVKTILPITYLHD